MLTLPDDYADQLQWADWLELNALATNGSASFATLRGLWIQEGMFDRDTEKLDRLSDDTSSELSSRLRAAGAGYPFNVDTDKIELRSNYSDYIPYVFSLCISYFGRTLDVDVAPFPRRMFEHICVEAAKGFLPGEGVRFGFPREDTMPKPFLRAIRRLTELIGEGMGAQDVEADNAKDDGLDVVAWRHFPDREPGKLLMFGNCASGHDWEGKFLELQPGLFCKSWLLNYPVSAEAELRAFFIPHRFPQNDWERRSRKAGIVFDRCRIALHAANDGLPNKARYIGWIDAILAQARAR